MVVYERTKHLFILYLISLQKTVQISFIRSFIQRMFKLIFISKLKFKLEEKSFNSVLKYADKQTVS